MDGGDNDDKTLKPHAGVREHDERIAAFNEEFKPGIKYPAKQFFDWHGRLTGSCLFGREQFARDKGIDLENDMFTVAEFCEMTKDAYGGDVIRRLAEMAKEET